MNNIFNDLFKNLYTKEKIEDLIKPFDQMTEEEKEEFQKQNRTQRNQGADEDE